MDFELKALKKQTLSYIKSLEKLPSAQSKSIYKQIIETLRKNDYNPNKTNSGYLIDINGMNLQCLNAIINLEKNKDIKNEI